MVHHRLDGVLSNHHMPHIRPLVGDGFPCCEAAACCVFLAFELAEVALFVSAVKFGFDVGKGGFAHAHGEAHPASTFARQ